MTTPKKPDARRRMYESWVEDHMADLYRMAYRLCGGSATAEDLVQEAFYHAWRSIDSLKDSAKARPWLFRILRFRYAHWVRAQVRQPRMANLTEDLGQQLHSKADRHTLDTMADQELLVRALNELDLSFKLPFLMVFLQGLTCRETAQELDIPLGTVLSRIHRARQFLRSRLTDADQALSDKATAQQTTAEEGSPQNYRIHVQPDIQAALKLRGEQR